jgi:hypothetical protein
MTQIQAYRLRIKQFLDLSRQVRPAQNRWIRTSVLAIALCGSFVGASQATTAGKINSTFNVSNTGSATYSIPVWAPPGVMGISPQLALSYSSQGGNGLLGVGWSVGGLSTVSRCSKTVAQDGVGGAPQLAADDRFCIDGNRLRATSGLYGADATTYQTELATFSQIISRGTAGNGPAWFEVKGKNGLTYEYGHTTDSAIVAQGSSSVRVWALSAIRDRFGNSMAVTYNNDTVNGGYRPSGVYYTATGGSSSGYQYQVLFTYQSRATADGMWSYTVGGKNNEFNQLYQIASQALTNGTWTTVRSYTLNYEQGPVTQRTRISSIQECSATDCFPATTISYQDGQAGWGGATLQPGNLNYISGSILLDLNGDGTVDMAYPDPSSGQWYYLMGATNGTYLGPYASGFASTNYNSAIPMDYNADGKMDILVPNSSGNWRVMYFQNSGTNFTVVDTTIPATGAGSGRVTAGDLDGDGRADLLYAVTSGTWATSDFIYYRLNTVSGLSTVQNTLATFLNCASCLPRTRIVGNGAPFGSVADSFLSKNTIVDFNGDNRADFLVLTGTCSADKAAQCGAPGSPITYKYQIYLSNSSGGYSALDVVGYGQGGTAATAAPLVGDFNGDGLSDIAFTIGGLCRASRQLGQNG